MNLVAEVARRLRLAEGGEKRLRLVIGLGLTGIALIGLSTLIPRTRPAQKASALVPAAHAISAAVASDAPNASGNQTSDPMLAYAAQLETKVQNSLAHIEGLGHVWVTVTMLQGEGTEYATNTTTDTKSEAEKQPAGVGKTTSETTSTTQVVSMRGSEASDVPVTVRRVAPKVAGVLVVVEGRLLAETDLTLTNATATVLGVPTYKVMVVGTQEANVQ